MFALAPLPWGCDAFALIDKASDPRVGDRFIGLDERTVIEIAAVFPMEDAGLGPGHEVCVEYTDSRTGDHLHNLFIWRFRQLAKLTVLGGHTFHAVEDDEE